MKSLIQIFKRLFESKYVTVLNLELISAVLFAIVALVGRSYVRSLVLAIIVLFMIVVYEYHRREKKAE